MFTRSHNEPAAAPQPLDFDQLTDRDVSALYAHLRPDQRTAIGGEFVRLFRLSGDPAAQTFVRPIEGMLSAGEVAEMHIFARDHLPRALEAVREHPVTREALAHPGTQAEPLESEGAIIQEPVEVADQSEDQSEVAEIVPARNLPLTPET